MNKWPSIQDQNDIIEINQQNSAETNYFMIPNFVSQFNEINKLSETNKCFIWL